MIPPDIARVLDLGWHVYPRAPRHRAAAFEGAADLATCDRATVADWARAYPRCGWYLVLGPSGLWALDVDAPRGEDTIGGIARLRILIDAHGELPPRPTIRTGGGGFALLFAHSGEPIGGMSGVPAPGIDPRRGRQTVTLPQTLHHRTGQPYQWAQEPSPAPDAPAWLLELVAPPPPPPAPAAAPFRVVRPGNRARYVDAAIRNAVERVAGAGEGRRNTALNAQTLGLARFVRGGDLTAYDVATAMAAAAHAAGLGTRETIATIGSAMRAGAAR